MNLTPTHYKATPASADQPDLGVAARAVTATKVYGKGDAEVRALDGVTVDFAPSRFTAIMGPSGSDIWRPPTFVGNPGSTLQRPLRLRAHAYGSIHLD